MPKILIIDDSISICESIKSLFEDKDYEVIYALSGKAGLDMFQAERPDIVILDMSLGDMWGLEVLQRIKLADSLCRVIVVTASSSEDNKRLAVELGAAGYISKPFSIEMLDDMVSGHRDDIIF